MSIRRLANISSGASSLSQLAATVQREFDNVYKNVEQTQLSAQLPLSLSGGNLEVQVATRSQAGVLSAEDYARFSDAVGAFGTVSAVEKTNWNAAYTHAQNISGDVHGATSSPTPSMLVRRDAIGSIHGPDYAPSGSFALASDSTPTTGIAFNYSSTNRVSVHCSSDLIFEFAQNAAVSYKPLFAYSWMYSSNGFLNIAGATGLDMASTVSGGKLALITGSVARLTVGTNGNIGIGRQDDDYHRLFVFAYTVNPASWYEGTKLHSDFNVTTSNSYDYSNVGLDLNAYTTGPGIYYSGALIGQYSRVYPSTDGTNNAIFDRVFNYMASVRMQDSHARVYQWTAYMINAYGSVVGTLDTFFGYRMDAGITATTKYFLYNGDIDARSYIKGWVVIDNSPSTPSGVSSLKVQVQNATSGPMSRAGEIVLQNTDTGNYNHTSIQNNRADGSINAEMQFVNVSHSTYESEIRFGTRIADGSLGTRWRIGGDGQLWGVNAINTSVSDAASYGHTLMTLSNGAGDTTHPGGVAFALYSGSFGVFFQAYHRSENATAGIAQWGTYSYDSESNMFAGGALLHLWAGTTAFSGADHHIDFGGYGYYAKYTFHSNSYWDNGSNGSIFRVVDHLSNVLFSIKESGGVIGTGIGGDPNYQDAYTFRGNGGAQIASGGWFYVRTATAGGTTNFYMQDSNYVGLNIRALHGAQVSYTLSPAHYAQFATIDATQTYSTSIMLDPNTSTGYARMQFTVDNVLVQENRVGRIYLKKPVNLEDTTTWTDNKWLRNATYAFAGTNAIFTGSGLSIEGASGKYTMFIDDLVVRGSMRIYELIINQIRATNGSLFVTSSAKIINATYDDNADSSYYLRVASDVYHGFMPGDLIRAKRFRQNGGGADLYVYDFRVNDSQTNGDLHTVVCTMVSMTPDPGTIPLRLVALTGTEFVRIGNTGTTANRDGAIYLTSDDTDAPFIDFIEGITAHSQWGNFSKLKMRVGKLHGITDGDFSGSALPGYGIWTNNAFLKGNIAVKSGTALAMIDNSIMIGNITGFPTGTNKGIKLSNTGTASSSGLFGYSSGATTSFFLKLDGTAFIAGWSFTSTTLSAAFDTTRSLTLSTVSGQESVYFYDTSSGTGVITFVGIGKLHNGTTWTTDTGIGAVLYDGATYKKLFWLSNAEKSIAGWEFTVDRFVKGHTSGAGTHSISINTTTYADTNWYGDPATLEGFEFKWWQAYNAGHIIVGQHALDGTTGIRSGYYGIQMMDFDGVEFFALGAAIANTYASLAAYRTARDAGSTTYNRIAGWYFNNDTIWGGNSSKASAAVGMTVAGDFGTGTRVVFGKYDGTNYGIRAWNGTVTYFELSSNSANNKIAGFKFTNAYIEEPNGSWRLSSTGGMQYAATSGMTAINSLNWLSSDFSSTLYGRIGMTSSAGVPAWMAIAVTNVTGGMSLQLENGDVWEVNIGDGVAGLGAFYRIQKQVGITISNTDSTYPLYVTGYNDSTNQIGGYFVYKVSASTCVSRSDARMKRSVVIIDNALEKVRRLRGVYFRYRNGHGDNGDGVHIGMIAQEVQRVFPELITAEQNGMLSLEYQSLVAPLVEAVKELADRLETLERKKSP